MIKLMIVDDEAGIRRGLRQYIDWSAWDIALVAEASDAREAEEKAALTRPDILISDIRMPGEDGLSLCRRLRQALPALRILLLTGYDDKEYLRAALSIGVQDYLLKPAGADTIISSVLKLKEEIMAERAKERRFQAQKDLLDENFTILQMYFITELLEGKGDSGHLRSRAEMLEIPLSGPCYQTAKACFPGPDGDLTSNHEIYQDYWRLLQIITTVGQQVPGSFFCELEPQEYFLLVNGADVTDAGEKIRALTGLLVTAAEQKGGRRAVVGVGPPAERPEDISSSYSGAKAAFAASAWEEERQIFSWPRDSCAGPDRQAEAERLVRDYIARISEGRTQAALDSFHQLAEYLRAVRAELPLVRDYARQLLTFTAHLSRRRPDSQALHDYLLRLEGFHSGGELTAWLSGQLDALLSHPEGELPAYSPIVQKAIAYMRRHYTEDITLQTLSKEIFLSPNYLGRLFRQETGFKLNEWLNRYRVERAKELLSDPSRRTAEIAEAVGFNSYKYFSICFQKFAECSLGDYRREHVRKS